MVIKHKFIFALDGNLVDFAAAIFFELLEVTLKCSQNWTLYYEIASLVGIISIQSLKTFSPAAGKISVNPIILFCSASIIEAMSKCLKIELYYETASLGY